MRCAVNLSRLINIAYAQLPRPRKQIPENADLILEVELTGVNVDSDEFSIEFRGDPHFWHDNVFKELQEL